MSVAYGLRKYPQHWEKASYTVEAALLCPFLCLIICLMVSFTLGLYRKVSDYAAECITIVEQTTPAAKIIRLECIAEGVWEKTKAKNEDNP